MLRFIMNRTGLLLVSLLLVLLTVSGSLGKTTPEFDTNRARLLGHMVQQQLTQHHYTQKKVDDEFSHAAFNLYLKQLDFQKRFLLKSDVERLKKYREFIDDGIRRGRLELPELGRELLNKRIEKVRLLTAALIEQGFDLDKDEVLETDPEKVDFSATEKEQQELWRKILKYQVLVRYLNLYEDEVGVEDGKLLEAKPEVLEELRQKAREKVKKSHESLFSRMLDETQQDHYDRYLNAITKAYDPHTNYLAPNLKEDFDIQMSGSLEGIGATLSEEDGYIKVVRIIPGSAAYRQGQLEADDLILQVAEGAADPVDITDTRLRDAVSLIRGKKGTEVRLTVKKPHGIRMVIPIVRDVVEIEETFVKGTTVIDEETGHTFGYIKIPSFYRDYNGGTGRNCTDDLRDELQRLNKEKITGLVLDLRNNGGGALSDAVSITGLFIESGPVVQVRNGEGKVRVLDDTNSSIEYDGPMVVLVNRFSASASEILAGALQDYGRALIVGDEHTHGKGTVQAMLNLDREMKFNGMDKYMPLGAVKVTIQKFCRVSGESTQERGVTPDIVLPSRMDGLKSGEKHLDNALPWDKIDPVVYDRVDLGADLAKLQANSSKRIDAEKAFSDIIELAEKARQRREETQQSLLLSKVLSEREEVRLLNLKTGEIPPHSAMGDDGSAGEEDDENKEPPTLDESIAEDPYVGEGVALLEDMIGQRS
ncbi:MAG TPA: carboxy terminal-processing peptidase [Geopsychrobacteraceae bacterium]|nr:carboxy terminal-processing peptidase [Geopsychrobacteraceae bacterium]